LINKLSAKSDTQAKHIETQAKPVKSLIQSIIIPSKLLVLELGLPVIIYDTIWD
jgi:hypothetical protein